MSKRYSARPKGSTWLRPTAARVGRSAGQRFWLLSVICFHSIRPMNPECTGASFFFFSRDPDMLMVAQRGSWHSLVWGAQSQAVFFWKGPQKTEERPSIPKPDLAGSAVCLELRCQDEIP